MLYGWFAGIAEQTLAASMVILAVLFLQYVLRRFINARVRYLLWLLVIARLLLPAVPDSPVSMLHILGNSKHFLTAVLDKGVDTGASKGEYQELPPGEGDQVTYPANNTALNVQGQTDTLRAGDGAVADNRSSAQASGYPLWMKIGTVIWLLGVMLMLLNGLLYIWRMQRERRRLRRVNAPELLKLVLATRRQFGIRRAIPIYTGGSANNPYMSGLMRPWIFVPEQALRELDASRLRHILAHELAHYKRRDMLWNLLGSIAATIHWFNPLMWLTIRCMKIDREVACDAYVLEVLGEEEAIDYGLTLVEFLKRFSRVRERREHLYFSNPQQRQQIRRRISMIQSFKKGSYRISAAAVILVALLSIVTLTGASREPGDSVAMGTKANPAVTLTESVPQEASPVAVTGQAVTASAAAANQSAALAPFTKPEIQNYKQIEYAIKHNLVQPLNIVVKKDGYQLTLKGLIADKYELILLFTAQTDSKRAFTGVGSQSHNLQLTDAVTGKVISGRMMNDAIVQGVSPAKQNNIMHGAAAIRLTTPLTTAPQKVAGEFLLTSLSNSELKQLEAVRAQMSAETQKAYAANPKLTSFETSPALQKKHDALKSKVKKSPPLKVAFEINPKVWEQESQMLSPEETLDVAGHKIKINLELTPLTTIVTLSSEEEGLFKDKAFLKTLNWEYYPNLMVESGNGEYTFQEGLSDYSYTDQEVKIVEESYFQLNQPKSIRLDFKNVIKSTVTQQMIVDLSNQ